MKSFFIIILTILISSVAFSCCANKSQITPMPTPQSNEILFYTVQAPEKLLKSLQKYSETLSYVIDLKSFGILYGISDEQLSKGIQLTVGTPFSIGPDDNNYPYYYHHYYVLIFYNDIPVCKLDCCEDYYHSYYWTLSFYSDTFLIAYPTLPTGEIYRIMQLESGIYAINSSLEGIPLAGLAYDKKINPNLITNVKIPEVFEPFDVSELQAVNPKTEFAVITISE